VILQKRCCSWPILQLDVICVDVKCVDVKLVDVKCVDVKCVDVTCVDVNCVDVMTNTIPETPGDCKWTLTIISKFSFV
jgi:hypothetical protein